MAHEKPGVLRFTWPFSGSKIFPKHEESQNSLEDIDLLKISKVFQGAWADSNIPLSSWKQPANKLMVFISSTFTDTHDERNILLEEVLPVFQKKGAVHGIEITFVDMRYGVRDENTLDHKTWNHCATEIERCLENSAGLFFLSLQADKYGYRPLPKYVDKTALDSRIIECSTSTQKLIKEWYTLDENAIPLVYQLNSLQDMNDERFWNVVLPTIRDALEGIPFDPYKCPLLKIGCSVTEWETKYALSLDDTKRKKSYWIHRQLKGDLIKAPKLICDAYDVKDNGMVLSKMQELQTWMTEQLSNPEEPGNFRIIKFSELSLKSYLKKGRKFQNYLRSWKEQVYSLMEKELERVIEHRVRWNADACGLGIGGKHADEILHHCQRAYEKAYSFQGREHIIQDVLNHLYNRSKPSTATGKYKGVTLAIVGVSGCGKSSIMAKTAQECYKLEQLKDIQQRRPVIIRFCGTSHGSNDGLALLQSICVQIYVILAVENTENTLIVPQSYEEAVKLFHQLIKQYPLIMILDCLDQLSNVYGERSRLSFLQGIDPHPESRIVVSTLPDELNLFTAPASLSPTVASSTAARSNWYQCETRLLESNVPRITIQYVLRRNNHPQSLQANLLAESHQHHLHHLHQHYQKLASTCNNIATISTVVKKLSVSLPTSTTQELAAHSHHDQQEQQDQHDHETLQAESILLFLLQKMHRRCTEKQLQYVLKQVEQESTMLYLQLASIVVSEWSSTAPESSTILAAGVKDLISQILSTVEREFGVILTRNALGLITYSVTGVHDSEIQDLLSLQDEVLDHVFQYSKLSLKQVPFHVWFRLRSSLSGLVVERDNGCLKWHHRQLQETAELRYMQEKPQLHRLMGQYFGDLLPRELLSSRFVSTQPRILNSIPVWFDESEINFRRCIEAPVHFLQADMYEEAVQELCNIEAIAAYAKIGQGFNMVHAMLELQEKIQNTIATNKAILDFDAQLVVAVATASKEEAVKLDRRRTPKPLPMNIDVLLEKLSQYLRWLRRDMGSIVLDPVNYIPITCTNNEPIAAIPYQDFMRLVEETENKKQSWSQVSNFSSHENASMNINPNIWTRALTVGGINRVDNTIISITGHTKKVLCIAFDPKDSRLCSGSEDTTVRVWDTRTGLELESLTGHTAAVTTVAYSKDGLIIVSGSMDKTIRIWDTKAAIELASCAGHEGAISAVSTHPFDQLFASCSEDRTIRVWSLSAALTSSSTARLSINMLTGTKKNSMHYLNQTLNSNMSSTLTGTLKEELNTVEKTLTTTSRKVSEKKARRNNEVSSKENEGLEEDKEADEDYEDGEEDFSEKLFSRENPAQVCVLRGHSKRVMTLAYSPDGKYIASGSVDLTIKIWSLEKEHCKATLTGHAGSIYSVAYTTDGHQLASASSDGGIKIWDTLALCELITLNGHKTVACSIAFDPTDNRKLISGSDDRSIRLWETTKGYELATFHYAHYQRITSVAYSIDGTKFASAGEDHVVKIHDANVPRNVATTQLQTEDLHHPNQIKTRHSSVQNIPPNKQIHNTSAKPALPKSSESTVIAHTGKVMAVCYTPDNKVLITASLDRTIRFWNASTLALIHVLDTCKVEVLAVSHDGKYLASTGDDKIITIWSISTTEYLCALPGHACSIRGLAFSCLSNGLGTNQLRYIASAADDTTVKVWAIKSKQQQQPTPTQTATITPEYSSVSSNNTTLTGHHNVVHSVCYSPDGKTLASASLDKTIIIWDSKKSLNPIQCGVLKGHTGGVFTICFSPDGKNIASGSQDQKIFIWDVKSQSLIFKLIGHLGGVYSICYSADGQRIISGSDDLSICVWETNPTSKSTLRMSSTKMIAAAVNEFIQNNQILNEEDEKTPFLAINNNTDSDNNAVESAQRTIEEETTTADQIPSPTPTTLTTARSPPPMNRMGSKLLSMMGSSFRRSFNAKQQPISPLFELRGHTGVIYSVHIAPDGKRIVSGSSDRTVRVWEAIVHTSD